MKPQFLILLAGVWLASLSPSLAESQRDRHVEAELLAEVTAAAPGSTFTAAIRLSHDDGWHTYWKHSATGYATQVTWSMPEGFEAGEPQWPSPILYEMAGYFEYVYEGTVLIPVRIRVPEAAVVGSSVRLQADVSWLMCADVCIPGKVRVNLEMPIAAQSAAAPEEVAGAIAEAVERLPGPADGIAVQAWQDGADVYLELSGEDLPSQIYFFDDQGYTEPTRTQELLRPETGRLILKLGDDPAGVDAVATLSGVVVAEGGWGRHAQGPGIAVSSPLQPGRPALALDGPAGASAPKTGMLGILGLGLVGGLILNLMPCVFPVIGIKIMGFVGKAGESRGKVALHGLVFTLGVLASFWALSILLLVLRAGGEQLGWGFQLQSPVFVFGLTVFFLVFALNLSGLFEIGQSVMGVGQELTGKSGLSGSFFSGILATVVATPCAAPFLAPALGAALALPALHSLIVFTSIGLGLSLPYLVLSVFPSLISRLPKPGPWMETFKQFMAFLLYATAGYLLWVLMGQLTDVHGYLDSAMRNVVFALVIVAMAAWIYGRWGAAYRKRPVRFRAHVVSALLLLGALYYGYPRPFTDAAADAPPVTWEKWAPGKAEALAAEGRTVYVDFTARWCVTCQTNKAAVFGSAEVLRFFAEHNIVALKADWTNSDPEITQALASFGRSAVPFNLIYAPGAAEPLILPELLTAGVVLESLEKSVP